MESEFLPICRIHKDSITFSVKGNFALSSKSVLYGLRLSFQLKDKIFIVFPLYVGHEKQIERFDVGVMRKLYKMHGVLFLEIIFEGRKSE